MFNIVLFFSLSYNPYMKLLKTESPYLDKPQWRKLFLATSVMIVCLYLVAMAFSLCGSKYFILDYQNGQMDRIESFLTEYRLIEAFKHLFAVLEYSIILAFVIDAKPKWYYILPFYAVPVILYYSFNGLPDFVQSMIPFAFYLSIPAIEQTISNRKSPYKERFQLKKYLKCLLRLAIAVALTLLLQMVILVIKSGSFDGKYVSMNMSGDFVYAIEYDIALATILFTIGLFLNREKGDSELCTHHGGSSQTSKRQSLKSNARNLTKTQRNKIRLLLLKVYLIQIGAFLLVMVLPFLLGKVFEFLVMYTAFCVARYILGFDYSLHYKKEVTCVTVGVVVFGILSLAVPFFYVVLVMAILMGVGLAIILHLSYKYKGFYLFAKVAKPDKFALLYAFFDGDLNDMHVKRMCRHKGLDDQKTRMVRDFVRGEKISYLAFKYNYSQRMFVYKLDEAIDELTN